jgi:hypothetical protein
MKLLMIVAAVVLSAAVIVPTVAQAHTEVQGPQALASTP